MKKIKTIAKKLFGAKRMKTLAMMLLCGTIATYAQNAAGDYTAGTDALATVTEEIAKYVPFVVKLCYAIAGVVAVVGAISVYIAMNNEEQDVKNILVLQNCQERKRKQIKVNTLWFNALQKHFAFRIFAELDIKKI